MVYLLVCFRPQSYGVAAIDSERVTDHKACGGTAKPENSIGDLFWSAKPTDGVSFTSPSGRQPASCQHLVGHRRMDQARTYGIDANAPCSVFESRALGESKDSVLGGVVGSTLGAPTSPPSEEQLTIAPLPCLRICRSSNFMQLHTPRRLMAITRSKVFPGGIGGFRDDILNAGIVVGCIQPPECGDSLLNHCLHLSVISDITTDCSAL